MGEDRKSRIRAERMKALAEYVGPDEVVSAAELSAYYRSLPEAEFQVRSGLPGLDQALDGFCGGELIVVTGPTKSGKTLFCQTITRNFYVYGYDPCLWFSYEVPPRQFLKSFPTVEGVLPTFFLPKELYAQSLDWFEDKCLESWEKNRTRIIFVDHLHFLVDMFRMRNTSLEIGAVVRRLKRFAVDFGFVIFLCAHCQKIPKGDEPSHLHLRDSSFVAQEADAVLVLWRTTDSSGQITNNGKLSVDIARRTGTMRRIFDIKKHRGLIVEIDKNDAR